MVSRRRHTEAATDGRHKNTEPTQDYGDEKMHYGALESRHLQFCHQDAGAYYPRSHASEDAHNGRQITEAKGHRCEAEHRWREQDDEKFWPYARPQSCWQRFARIFIHQIPATKWAIAYPIIRREFPFAVNTIHETLFPSTPASNWILDPDRIRDQSKSLATACQFALTHRRYHEDRARTALIKLPGHQLNQ